MLSIEDGTCRNGDLATASGCLVAGGVRRLAGQIIQSGLCPCRGAPFLFSCTRRREPVAPNYLTWRSLVLDLNEVAVFVHVARYGSFAEAARQMRVPSTTVGRRIRQLEAHLGARLMQRSTRKLTLTSAGEAFHARCGPAIEKLMDAEQLQVADNQEVAGLVRVAAPASFFSFFQMAWVSDFMHAHPNVRLEFVLSDSLADLIADRIDLAFRAGPLQESSYVTRRIFPSLGGLLASPEYLAKHGSPQSLEELAQHECLTLPPISGSCAIWRLQDARGNVKDVRVRGRLVSNSLAALQRAACSGLGIAALPSILTAHDLATGRLVPVLPQYVRTGRGLSVLFASRQQIPPAVSAFACMAIEKLSSQSWKPALSPKRASASVDRTRFREG